MVGGSSGKDNTGQEIIMKQLSLFSIFLFTCFLLFLAPNLTKAILISEATEIPYQINNSNRIAIGTVREINIS